MNFIDLPKSAQSKVKNPRMSSSSTGDDQKVYTLEAGEYRFPFTFQLPVKIPPSFNSNEGKIIYNLSVLLSV